MRRSVAFLALLLAAIPVCAGAEGIASGTLSASSTVKFVIRIPKMLQMRLIDHPSSVLVTAADIALGEIVVRGARVDIAANNRNGFLMRAELLGQAFTEMRLSGLARDVRAEGGALVTPMPSTAGGPRLEPRNVEYRLRLAADASPGRYAWPVALTIQDP